MARSDLVLSLIRARQKNDDLLFRQTVEAIIAEERGKQHHTLANQISAALKSSEPIQSYATSRVETLFFEREPQRRISDLVLSIEILNSINELIEEQRRAELLRSYGLEPRNRLMLLGPPGNGKTSVAEGIAEALAVPLISVRYDGVIGSYLGETNQRLREVFDYVKGRKCVLFFDEFDTVGKERGDAHDSGEIKRVVSTLLLQIDSLPSHVVTIAATNHQELLDRAVWRRFQIKLDLEKPQREQVREWLERFFGRIDRSASLDFLTISDKLSGINFSDLEEFGLDVLRRYTLEQPDGDLKKIVRSRLAKHVDSKAKLTNARRKKVPSRIP